MPLYTYIYAGVTKPDRQEQSAQHLKETLQYEVRIEIIGNAEPKA